MRELTLTCFLVGRVLPWSIMKSMSQPNTYAPKYAADINREPGNAQNQTCEVKSFRGHFLQKYTIVATRVIKVIKLKNYLFVNNLFISQHPSDFGIFLKAGCFQDCLIAKQNVKYILNKMQSRVCANFIQ